MTSSPTPEPDTAGAIAAYGFLSDCQSAALVSDSGSVDWWCVPRFDSSSVFGRMLDPDAGHWVIRPVEGFSTERNYIGHSLVVSTSFTTARGVVAISDALALDRGAQGHDIGLVSPHVLQGDYKLAMGDIFGGNAFLPVLFLFVTLISGQAVLPRAQATDIYLTALGALLTTVYLVGLVFRPNAKSSAWVLTRSSSWSSTRSGSSASLPCPSHRRPIPSDGRL